MELQQQQWHRQPSRPVPQPCLKNLILTTLWWVRNLIRASYLFLAINIKTFDKSGEYIDARNPRTTKKNARQETNFIAKVLRNTYK